MSSRHRSSAFRETLRFGWAPARGEPDDDSDPRGGRDSPAVPAIAGSRVLDPPRGAGPPPGPPPFCAMQFQSALYHPWCADRPRARENMQAGSTCARRRRPPPFAAKQYQTSDALAFGTAGRPNSCARNSMKVPYLAADYGPSPELAMNLIAVMLGRNTYAAAFVVTKLERPVTSIGGSPSACGMTKMLSAGCCVPISGSFDLG